MLYYKIIKDNSVVDVNNKFFRILKKHRNIVESESKYAQLIQSSDGKELYTAKWLCPLPEWAVYEKVEAIIISEEEYLQLKEQLQVQEVVEIPETKSEIIINEEEIVEMPQELPMSAVEMRKRIIELENLVKQLLNK